MCTKILMESIAATTHSVVDMAITSLQQLIRWSIWPLHHCSKRFGGHYGHYIAATTDSVVNMAITSLQQLIRWSIWAITSLQQLIRWSIWPLHRCSKRFGGQYGHYIVAANDSGVNMAITSLQQLIRGSIWAITSLQQLIRWSIWPFTSLRRPVFINKVLILQTK